MLPLPLEPEDEEPDEDEPEEEEPPPRPPPPDEPRRLTSHGNMLSNCSWTEEVVSHEGVCEMSIAGMLLFVVVWRGARRLRGRRTGGSSYPERLCRSGAGPAGPPSIERHPPCRRTSALAHDPCSSAGRTGEPDSSTPVACPGFRTEILTELGRALASDWLAAGRAWHRRPRVYRKPGTRRCGIAPAAAAAGPDFTCSSASAVQSTLCNPIALVPGQGYGF